MNAGPTAGQASSRRKVLLLENSSAPDEELHERFSRNDFQLAVSGHEADGLARVAQWQPDIVLISPLHVTGDFVAYCDKVRTAVPQARVVVTSHKSSEQLFGEYPRLKSIVDGVMVRRGHAAATAPPPPGTGAAPAAAPGQPARDSGEMGAEFQRQLETKYLEVEELKRRLREAERKQALVLATEQLKCVELETKLDNLLRMKEDFEYRAQNEIEERTNECEALREQLAKLEERALRTQTEQTALHAELESTLIAKEQLEERSCVSENVERSKPARADAAAADALRIAALEEQVGRLRAAVAEGQAAEEAAEARREALEQELVAEKQARAEQTQRAQESEQRAEAGTQARERAELERAQLRSLCANLEERLAASDAARDAVAAEADDALAELNGRIAALESGLTGERTTRLEAERRGGELGTRVEELGHRVAEAGDRARDLTAERDRLRGLLLEREGHFQQETRELRETAEAAERELEKLRAETAERSGSNGDQLRLLQERSETFDRELEERDRQVAALRGELTSLGETHGRERLQLEERVREALEAAQEARVRTEREVAALASEREASQERERETGRLLEAEQLRIAGLEERSLEAGRLFEAERARAAALEEKSLEAGLLLEAAHLRAVGLERRLVEAPAREPGVTSAELRRIEELLEEVVTRARTDAVDHARREAEFSTRLQGALEERRLLQERFDRASAEATERERRAASLLQSAIDRGRAPGTELANLPAVVPFEPEPGFGSSREAGFGLSREADPGLPRRTLILTGLVVVVLALVLGIALLRRTTTGTVSAPPPVRQQPVAAPAADASGPREVWDRWTRTDVSGGVLVQATLRNESELRAEVEAEQRSRGWSAVEARAELARRLEVFRFDSAWYVTVYLKNLTPGYPVYLDDLAGRFRLRDRAGREAPAFVPPGLERDLRVFTFGVGPSGEPIYEATISLGFPRASFTGTPGYLQLVISDVGTASRRVLTWELE